MKEDGIQEIIAKIESTSLGVEDHGVMTGYLNVSYGNGGAQSIGGYALDEWDPEQKRRVGTAYGLEWIARVIEACGVEKWEDLPGRTIFVLKGPGQELLGMTGSLGIKPLPTEPGRQFLWDELDHMLPRALEADGLLVERDG